MHLMTGVQKDQQRTMLDASACLAVINSGVLLEGAARVPSTETFAGAQVASNLPVPVTVVQRSDQAIGVELPNDLGKDNQDLVRYYTTVPLAETRHPSCPMTPDAREVVRRTIQAMLYG